MTYTVSTLEVDPATYADIEKRVRALGPDYDHMFMRDGGIDLTHIAVAPEETAKAVSPALNPWVPMTVPIDLKHLGKLAEETNELGAAIARCIIQGIREREPVTGKLNRDWLEDEMADVLAGIELCVTHFGLARQKIEERKERKKEGLRTWHQMLA